MTSVESAASPFPPFKAKINVGAVGPVDLVHGRKHVPGDQTEKLGIAESGARKGEFAGQDLHGKK